MVKTMWRRGWRKKIPVRRDSEAESGNSPELESEPIVDNEIEMEPEQVIEQEPVIEHEPANTSER